MRVSVRGCCRLEVLVYTAGLSLTLLYLLAGLGGVVWWVNSPINPIIFTSINSV